MKKITKLFIVVLALAMLFCLASCDNDTPIDDGTSGSPDTTSAPAAEPVIFAADGKTDYVIVRAEDADPNNLVSSISDFYKAIGEKYSLKVPALKITTDWEKPGTDPATRPKYEILIGATNREESQQLLSQLKEYDYAIAVVGEKLVICGGSDAGTLQAMDYFLNNLMTDGALSLPADFSYICQSPPQVISFSPENYYYFEDVYTPTISVDFVCSPSVDLTRSTLVIDGKDYTANAKWDEKSVTLSGVTFESGTYEAALTLVDGNGNTYKHTQSFGCGSADVMYLYSGEVHAHTSDSDGQGTPTDAYAYARDVAKLDFFSVTDHSNSADRTKLLATSKVAEKFTEPGKFIGLYGYEQTYNISSGFYGHLNVLNTLTFCTRSSHKLSAFYKIMSSKPEAIVMFNHPGYSWGNFLEYEMYSKEMDEVLTLSEIKGSGYDTEYALSLTKGWHVSPMYNEDNHSPDWGNAKEACGYALAPALTRANIVEALKKNRTYTTTDKSLKIYYKVNDKWMGARLDNPDTLKISVDLSTSKAGLGTVYLIAEDNIIVAQQSLGNKRSFKWELELSPDYDYYYVKVVADGIWAVTAPVWVENRDMINITGIEQSLVTGNSTTDDHRVSVKISNDSGKTMTDVKVAFYRSSLSGFAQTAPATTVEIGTLAAGKTADAYADFTYQLNIPRISAVVTGKIDGKSYSDTVYTQLSQLYMTEVLVTMNAYNSIGKPFVYIELYNNTDAPLNLANYSLRYHPKAGSKAEDLANNTWKPTGTVQPHSTVILWLNSNARLTVDDFNKNFGTSLVEGKDIIKVSGAGLAAEKAVQIELLSGSTVINRIWYNWGETTLDVKANKAITYNYQREFTLTSTLVTNSADPTPGKLTEGQVPAQTK